MSEVKLASGKSRIDWLILLSFLAGAFTVSALVVPSKALLRYELQSVDQRFEMRSWLNSHFGVNVQPSAKVVIFNRLPEDEPPSEAFASMPWLKELRTYPIQRKTMAGWIHFLRKCGAKVILIDQDFATPDPQDAELARELVNAHTGSDGLIAVPVYFVRNIVRGSYGKLNVLHRVTESASIGEQIALASTNRFGLADFAGSSIMLPDEDQVVRRCLLSLPTSEESHIESVVLLAARAISPSVSNADAILDIDFIDGPNSNLFPVRPLTYLVDPERRKELLIPNPLRQDVHINGALVLIGDGIADLFNTPVTHNGLMQMSGTEVLAQAINTLKSNSEIRWIDEDFDGWNCVFVCLFSSGITATLWLVWRETMHTMAARESTLILGRSYMRIALDAGFVLILIGLFLIVAALTFYFHRLLVPVIAPSLAIVGGAFTAVIAERNRDRKLAFNYQLALVKHEMRRDFVQRINHDLNAPVTVLNWALADMEAKAGNSEEVRENIGVLIRTSDRLCMLLDEISRTYEDNSEAAIQAVIDLREPIANSVDLLTPLAKARRGTIKCILPDQPVCIRSTKPDLLRIFDNLIKNAFRHNPEGTTLSINLYDSLEWAEISVSDDGSGISKEKARLILESPTPPGGIYGSGQGLGLGIVISLIKGLKGELRIKTRVNADQGSVSDSESYLELVSVYEPECRSVSVSESQLPCVSDLQIQSVTEPNLVRGTSFRIRLPKALANKDGEMESAT